MQCIITRFLPATNFKGSRIVATASGGRRIVVGYDHAEGDPHIAAARALAMSLGWKGRFAIGRLKDGGAVVTPLSDAPDDNLMI